MITIWEKIKEKDQNAHTRGSHKIAIASAIIFGLVVFMLAIPLRATFYPTITINPNQELSSIDPNLYGYSTSSDFRNFSELQNAVIQNGAKSVRLFDGYETGEMILSKVNGGKYTILERKNSPYTNQNTYTLKVIVQGSHIKVLINEVLQFETDDSSFAQGGIGLISSYNEKVSFDDAYVRNMDNGETLFYDDFTGGEDPDWQSLDLPSWTSQGTWYVQNGEYYHAGEQPMVIKYLERSDWRNYNFSVKITPRSSNAERAGFVGVAFRYQDKLNSYRFMWRSSQRKPIYSGKPWEIKEPVNQWAFPAQTDTSPIVVANMKDTPEAAHDLVDRLNNQLGYNIEYFELGNEHYIWDDAAMSPEEYANQVIAFSIAMKQADPTIKVGANVMLDTFLTDWEPELIRFAAYHLDFLIVHYYPVWANGNEPELMTLALPEAYKHNYKTGYGQDKGVKERLESLLETYAPERADDIGILVTEFNTTDDVRGKSLIYGLSASDQIGAFTEDGVKRGLFHGIDTFGSHWGAFTPSYIPRPSALAVEMYAKHYGDIAIKTAVSGSPTYRVDAFGQIPQMTELPYIVSYASKNAEGTKIYLMVINKHLTSDQNVNLKFKNAVITNSYARVFELNGPSPYATNENGEQISIEESFINNARKNFTYNFPAHSVTLMELSIEEKIDEIGYIPESNEDEHTDEPQDKPNDNGQDSDKNDSKKSGKKQEPLGDAEIITGAGIGGSPHVRSFNAKGLQTGSNFYAYQKDFKGGIKVAYGDVNGDGQKEIITGASKGGGPHVRIFKRNGVLIGNIFPFHPDFHGGVNVASGDVDGDGIDEIAVSQATLGEAWVKVYKFNKNKDVISSFNAFGSVESGASIALGDVDSDGADEIIVGAGPGGGPQIRVFETNGSAKSIQFFAFHQSYRDGIMVSAGDVNNDGKDEIAVSQSGKQEAWIKVYQYNEQKTVLGEWKAYLNYPVGANVAFVDIDKDGKDEIITGTMYGAPQVRAFEYNGHSKPLNFYAYSRDFRGGVYVAGGYK